MMGYVLLCIENLASALLLAAILLALVGKIRWRWLSRPVGTAAVLLPLAAGPSIVITRFAIL